MFSPHICLGPGCALEFFPPKLTLTFTFINFPLLELHSFSGSESTAAGTGSHNIFNVANHRLPPFSLRTKF